jgi:hypothetical protein
MDWISIPGIAARRYSICLEAVSQPESSARDRAFFRLPRKAKQAIPPRIADGA